MFGRHFFKMTLFLNQHYATKILTQLLKVVGNKKKGGQEVGKWQELASDRGDRGLLAL
jgi:hypothetical protein